MKLKPLIRSLILLAPLALLTGCVGYNTALFMTKSNAGLDFDAKPPTVEINISRKEGVVEPVFEGGKAPPVMASFGSKIGSGGGVGRFLFGVDQTFAGGDAAVTMSKLYDDTNAVSEAKTNLARFDSGLPLSSLPKANTQTGKGWLSWKKRLFGLPEPGEVRPFFFGTDTQLGVKVGWNGVGGPYPDTIKIGFNRKEIAIAPVTLSPREVRENEAGADELRTNVVRIPSFLATVDSNVEGAGSVGVSWMQYFATGESASYLARQYGVRKAMLERADPKAALKADELAGKEAYDQTQIDAEKIVAFAKQGAPDANSLNPVNVTTLVKDTGLTVDDVKKLTPDQFRQKLARSWAARVPSLKKNLPQP